MVRLYVGGEVVHEFFVFISDHCCVKLTLIMEINLSVDHKSFIVLPIRAHVFIVQQREFKY